MVTCSTAARHRHGTPPPKSTEATRSLQFSAVGSLTTLYKYETVKKATALGAHDADAAIVGRRTVADVVVAGGVRAGVGRFHALQASTRCGPTGMVPPQAA
jgi:hypothetical protein